MGDLECSSVDPGPGGCYAMYVHTIIPLTAVLGDGDTLPSVSSPTVAG